MTLLHHKVGWFQSILTLCDIHVQAVFSVKRSYLKDSHGYYLRHWPRGGVQHSDRHHLPADIRFPAAAAHQRQDLLPEMVPQGNAGQPVIRRRRREQVCQPEPEVVPQVLKLDAGRSQDARGGVDRARGPRFRCVSADIPHGAEDICSDYNSCFWYSGPCELDQ